MRAVLTIFLSFCSLIFMGCNYPAWDGLGSWDGEVIDRTQSKDGKIEALIVKGSPGATSGFTTVFIWFRREQSLM